MRQKISNLVDDPKVPGVNAIMWDCRFPVQVSGENRWLMLSKLSLNPSG
jgi:hypothetical protein